jgi:nicotinamide mononucleotide adenylyltransferase
LTVNEVGKLIRVKVTGTGNYTGTKISEAVGPVTDAPEPEVKGSIARDPGNTGGKDLTVTVDGETITFDGNIEWYPVDESVGRNEAGNRVGVEITAPEGFDASGAVVTIGDDTYENLFTAEKNYFWWYPLVTQAGQQFTATVVWNESSTQVFTVKIADTAKLEKAPVEEVTRTAAPTQDPGNTGGDLEYNFADGTLTISGTIADIPESTNPAGVTAKWIGVNIPKPTTDVADAGTIHLTIKEAGKEPVVHESVSYGEGDPFLYYFGAQAGGRSITLEIVWNGKHKETLVIEYVDTTEPEPEVKGSIARDPGKTGGKDLDVDIDGNTITFDGNIEWYPADPDVGRNEAGNRVGVEIIAPEGFDASGAVVTIDGEEYNDLFTAEKNYFWWYPLVSEAGETFTATVVWNEVSTQVFKVVIGENVTLEPAPDNTAPKLVGVSPEAGEVNLEYDETFKLEVTASDENLYELEVDHSMEATLPEFSVYADADNPYGDSASEFAEAGVEVIYDAEEQKWTIDFGEEVTNQIVDNEGITFYLVLVDEAGNKWGSMDPTTEENTFAYTVTQEPAPEASTYKFSYEVPEEVIAGEEYTVPVTIEPETVGDFGYDKVRFNVEVTTPDGATLQLLAEDTNGVEHDVAAIGYWGPENGFTIDANYSEATDFRAIFSAAGKYSITFSLVDLDADKVLITETVEITAEPTQEEIDAAKADFLADLKNKVKDIDVAAVAIDEENITVTFDRDTTPSAVYQAANELVAALKGELEAAKLTLDEEESFDLTEEDVAAQIALYLLDGTSPQDFLKGKEAVEASYTAEATNEDGITFTLEG